MIEGDLALVSRLAALQLARRRVSGKRVSFLLGVAGQRVQQLPTADKTWSYSIYTICETPVGPMYQKLVHGLPPRAGANRGNHGQVGEPVVCQQEVEVVLE